MAFSTGKSEHAFRTIGELATDLGVPQHILRYWETRFPQLRPLQRAGNRRYYRPADVALARRIHHLLTEDGYTIRGVQQLLAKGDGTLPDDLPAAAARETADTAGSTRENQQPPFPVEQLRELRLALADALDKSKV
ncbi:MAG: MerR family transcriptional regulator [Allosphingosinicella sp.]